MDVCSRRHPHGSSQISLQSHWEIFMSSMEAKAFTPHGYCCSWPVYSTGPVVYNDYSQHACRPAKEILMWLRTCSPREDDYSAGSPLQFTVQLPYCPDYECSA
ncbi:uncharacterized protein LOC144105035 [Amblyomma americanum]